MRDSQLYVDSTVNILLIDADGRSTDHKHMVDDQSEDSPAVIEFRARFDEVVAKCARKYKDRTALGMALNADKATTSSWYRRGKIPDKYADEFAELTGFNLHWVNRAKAPKFIGKSDGSSASDETGDLYVRFQLLDGAAGMGDGVENEDYPEVIREVEIAGWEVRRKLGFMPQPGRIKLLTGRGPSMRPMIDNGDVVMVDTEVRAFEGDAVYVINVDGETLIKLLQVRSDGLYVVSVNTDYPAYRVDREGLFVGGKVVSVLGMKAV